MGDKVQIISMNVQGLGDKVKRKDVLNFLKSKKYSICFLQDTHFDRKEENYIRSQWGFDCYFSFYNTQSRGVAILVNNNFEFKFKSIEQDCNGNLLILNCNIGEKNVVLAAIYGPNRDSPEFYENLCQRLSKYENTQFIIGGDFNLTINPDIDCYNYVNINNPNARNSVINMMVELNLVDCWRENNLEKLEYTWFRRNPIKKARLDFFLISEELFTDIDNSKILPGYRTDHSLIYVSFEFGKFKKGKSYWKFNNSFLKDQHYVSAIKKTINETLSQYVLEIPPGYGNVSEIPLEEIAFNINDQLLFETLLLAIRGTTIAYASQKKKNENNKENKLLKEIEILEKQTNTNYIKLDEKKEELLKLRKKKMEGVFIRSKAKWIQEGEKPTKYFCNLENRNYVSKFMNCLTTTNGVLLKTQDEILAETKKHYKSLYTARETENVSITELLQNENIPKLTPLETQKIEGNLTYTEMLNSLKRMKNNTSPGNDGFTVEFFKFFWNDIGILLVRSINYAFSIGELSATQKQGVITCIPKGNKDKALLKNWRPISLLNVSYKIASASIAFRIKNAIGNIINEDQTGFLPGRLMATNVRLLYDILFYSEKNNIPGLLVLIDFAAAFDTVSWSFMLKVLEYFNFGESIINWVKLFYNKAESCVIVNGHMSEWFSLQRGCRQGDALSPYLFIICAEILSILIRKNPKIKGIRINGTDYTVSQYADDTSLTLNGSEESLSNTLQTLKFYGRISGLNINTEKTKVIWFGSCKNSQRILCPEYNLTWENTAFTVLGVKFSTNLQEMIDLNYNSKIEEIRTLFACWSKRELSPIGKIVVIKTIALAKLNHLFLGIPNPSQDKLVTIQTMFYNFLWNNSRDKVKRSILTQEHKNGGLKMISVQEFSLSLKATWIRRIRSMNNKFSNLTMFVCPALRHMYKYGTDYIKRQLQQDLNPFWKDVLYSYYVISHNILPSNESQIYSVNLWYNPYITVGGSSICYKRWLAAGVIFIGDLVNADGNLFSYQYALENLRLRTNFLEYNGMLEAIRNYLLKIRADYLPRRSFILPIPLALGVINKDKKGCKTIYQTIMKKCEFPKTLQKWIEDFAVIPNSNFNARTVIYETVFKITRDPKLQWFQYRINHRILGTNYLLKKMNILDEDICSLCNDEQETLIHLFWHCEVSQQFWRDLKEYINTKCNLTYDNWTAYDIIFGNPKLHKVVNLILLQAKLFLYYNKIKKQRPCFESFKKQIYTRYQTERFIANKNYQLPKFETLWENFKNLAT